MFTVNFIKTLFIFRVKRVFIIFFNFKAQSQLDIIQEGLKLIEDYTRKNGKNCIKFVPRTTEGNA